MTHDEIEKLKIKISRAEANEQIELAELLVNELIANNECYNIYEYDIDKSYECIDDLTFFLDKIKNKIELRKIKKIKDRYNKLSKSKRKTLLKEIEKLLTNLETNVIKKPNIKCRQEGHLYNEWEELRCISEQLKKDENENRKFIKCEEIYWEKKCKRCGYEQRLSSEPEEITIKKMKNKSN